jgi:hypothetical protein
MLDQRGALVVGSRTTLLPTTGGCTAGLPAPTDVDITWNGTTVITVFGSDRSARRIRSPERSCSIRCQSRGTTRSDMTTVMVSSGLWLRRATTHALSVNFVAPATTMRMTVDAVHQRP